MAKRQRGNQASIGPLWSVPVKVAEIPETGRRIEVAADEPARAAIVRAAGLLGLPRLELAADLVRVGREGVRMTGQVSATVDQACVVTLEPVQNDVVESINVVFVPDAATAAGEVSLDPGDDEEIEALRGGVIDVGAIAAEFLILGIDPYPRKAGVAFDAPAAADPSNHPFAALAALKKGT